jgi:hypothetical protein|tara:strand:- start:232 stop:498 length:267 start_codon:yes stop_codon:yes gene_type:complete
MAKKYIYSEKKVIKEFLGSLLTKIIVNRNSKVLQNLIKNDPIIAKYDKEIQKLGAEFLSRVEKKRKQDPDYDKDIARLNKQVQKLRAR